MIRQILCLNKVLSLGNGAKFYFFFLCLIFLLFFFSLCCLIFEDFLFLPQGTLFTCFVFYIYSQRHNFLDLCLCHIVNASWFLVKFVYLVTTLTIILDFTYNFSDDAVLLVERSALLSDVKDVFFNLFNFSCHVRGVFLINSF